MTPSSSGTTTTKNNTTFPAPIETPYHFLSSLMIGAAMTPNPSDSYVAHQVMTTDMENHTYTRIVQNVHARMISDALMDPLEETLDGYTILYNHFHGRYEYAIVDTSSEDEYSHGGDLVPSGFEVATGLPPPSELIGLKKHLRRSHEARTQFSFLPAFSFDDFRYNASMYYQDGPDSSFNETLNDYGTGSTTSSNSYYHYSTSSFDEGNMDDMDGGNSDIPIESIRTLVIPIQFANHRSGDGLQQRSWLPTKFELDTFFSSPLPHPVYAPTGSVRSVLRAISNNHLNHTFEVLDWIPLSQDERYYSGFGKRGFDRSKLEEAFDEALDYVNLHHDKNLGHYDQDGDGILDSILFVHSGYPAEMGGVSEGGVYFMDRIWSHSSTTTNSGMVAATSNSTIFTHWRTESNLMLGHYHIVSALHHLHPSFMGSFQEPVPQSEKMVRIGVVVHQLLTPHFIMMKMMEEQFFNSHHEYPNHDFHYPYYFPEGQFHHNSSDYRYYPTTYYHNNSNYYDHPMKYRNVSDYYYHPMHYQNSSDYNKHMYYYHQNNYDQHSYQGSSYQQNYYQHNYYQNNYSDYHQNQNVATQYYGMTEENVTDTDYFRKSTPSYSLFDNPWGIFGSSGPTAQRCPPLLNPLEKIKLGWHGEKPIELIIPSVYSGMTLSLESSFSFFNETLSTNANSNAYHVSSTTTSDMNSSSVPSTTSAPQLYHIQQGFGPGESLLIEYWRREENTITECLPVPDALIIWRMIEEKYRLPIITLAIDDMMELLSLSDESMSKNHTGDASIGSPVTDSLFDFTNVGHRNRRPTGWTLSDLSFPSAKVHQNGFFDDANATSSDANNTTSTTSTSMESDHASIATTMEESTNHTSTLRQNSVMTFRIEYVPPPPMPFYPTEEEYYYKDGSVPSVTPSPTLQPSMQPTNSSMPHPVPTVPTNPVPVNCKDPNQKLFKLNLTTDVWGSETTWELVDVKRGQTALMTGGPYPNYIYQTYEYGLCIDYHDSCFKFVIKDSHSDGIFSVMDGSGYKATIWDANGDTMFQIADESHTQADGYHNPIFSTTGGDFGDKCDEVGSFVESPRTTSLIKRLGDLVVNATMFNVEATEGNDIVIIRFASFHLASPSPMSSVVDSSTSGTAAGADATTRTEDTKVTIKVFTKNGSYQGYESNPEAWTLVQELNDIIPTGLDEWTTLGINFDSYVPVMAGTTQAFYIEVDPPLLIVDEGRRRFINEENINYVLLNQYENEYFEKQGYVHRQDEVLWIKSGAVVGPNFEGTTGIVALMDGRMTYAPIIIYDAPTSPTISHIPSLSKTPSISPSVNYNPNTQSPHYAQGTEEENRCWARNSTTALPQYYNQVPLDIDWGFNMSSNKLSWEVIDIMTSFHQHDEGVVMFSSADVDSGDGNMYDKLKEMYDMAQPEVPYYDDLIRNALDQHHLQNIFFHKKTLCLYADGCYKFQITGLNGGDGYYYKHDYDGLVSGNEQEKVEVGAAATFKPGYYIGWNGQTLVNAFDKPTPKYNVSVDGITFGYGCHWLVQKFIEDNTRSSDVHTTDVGIYKKKKNSAEDSTDQVLTEHSTTRGLFVDIHSKMDIVLRQWHALLLGGPAGEAAEVKIYTKVGSYKGYETLPHEWKLVYHNTNVICAGIDQYTYLPDMKQKQDYYGDEEYESKNDPHNPYSKTNDFNPYLEPHNPYYEPHYHYYHESGLYEQGEFRKILLSAGTTTSFYIVIDKPWLLIYDESDGEIFKDHSNYDVDGTTLLSSTKEEQGISSASAATSTHVGSRTSSFVEFDLFMGSTTPDIEFDLSVSSTSGTDDATLSNSPRRGILWGGQLEWSKYTFQTTTTTTTTDSSPTIAPTATPFGDYNGSFVPTFFHKKTDVSSNPSSSLSPSESMSPSLSLSPSISKPTFTAQPTKKPSAPIPPKTTSPTASPTFASSNASSLWSTKPKMTILYSAPWCILILLHVLQ